METRGDLAPDGREREVHTHHRDHLLQAPERVAHTHLKDVDASVAARVQDGRLTYYEAVRQGMYRPLGTGDVDVPAIVGHLRRAGYDGWYVMEQDTVLDAEPTGEGPLVDVRSSADHLRSVLRTA